MKYLLENIADALAGVVLCLAIFVAMAVWGEAVRENTIKAEACKAKGGAYVQSKCVKVIQ